MDKEKIAHEVADKLGHPVTNPPAKPDCDQVYDVVMAALNHPGVVGLIDSANKKGWNDGVKAAMEILETGAGADPAYIREQLLSGESDNG